MASFKDSLLLEFLSKLFEPFDLSRYSEFKLFYKFEKLIVKVAISKWLRCRREQLNWSVNLSLHSHGQQNVCSNFYSNLQKTIYRTLILI